MVNPSITGIDSVDEADVRERSMISLRATYNATMPSALSFAHITIGAVIAVFWRHVDNASLLILWGTLVSIVMVTTSTAVNQLDTRHFLKVAVSGELASSVCWALLPIIALPASSDWQAMQGVLLVALVLSTLGNSTSNVALHVAATVPLGVISAIAFAINGTGSARWLAAAFAIGIPFTLASGALLRQVQSDLFASSLRNEHLAETLQSEGDRLKVLNDQLEIANTHLDAQSQHDVLTGLYNRAGFLGRLNRAVADNPGRVVVCYLDIDGFKRVNDAFGHRFGDLVLCAASRRITRVLRENEVLARQGGDELTIFGVIDDTANGVADLGERLQSVFLDPFLIEDRKIEIGVSVGLVWLEENTTPDDLMRFADTALYKAKGLGGRRCEIFDEAMRTDLDRRTRLQAELGNAFSRSEITPYLQPIVDVSTGQIATAEALARWEHDRGVRPAGDFIDTARDLGMLDRINDVVVQKVFDFQRDQRRLGINTCPITVNASPIHLEAMLNRVLAEPALDPMIIEITEDGIFSDLDGARRLLQRARAAGVKVLLDDFGVGFSSLSIATELPVDGFKIDRGFVASLEGNPSALAAVEAIVQLAKRMNLHVVAEGVETIEQLCLLRELGVGFAQGFLFSPAVPMTQFSEWLRTDHHFDVAQRIAV